MCSENEPDNKKENITKLSKSLLKFGHLLNVLPIYDPKQRNISKLTKMNEYFQAQDYSNDDYIIILDAYDVLCAKDPKQAIEYLENNKIDILISTEDVFGKHHLKVKNYYDNYNKLVDIRQKKFKYINSGIYIGKANKIKLLFNNICEKIEEIHSNYNRKVDNIHSDQSVLSYYLYMYDFVRNKSLYNIHLDMKDEICFTNTLSNRRYKVQDYVFIHTWGLFSDYDFKLKKQQIEKYRKIYESLKI